MFKRGTLAELLLAVIILEAGKELALSKSNAKLILFVFLISFLIRTLHYAHILRKFKDDQSFPFHAYSPLTIYLLDWLVPVLLFLILLFISITYTNFLGVCCVIGYLDLIYVICLLYDFVWCHYEKWELKPPFAGWLYVDLIGTAFFTIMWYFFRNSKGENLYLVSSILMILLVVLDYFLNLDFFLTSYKNKLNNNRIDLPQSGDLNRVFSQGKSENRDGFVQLLQNFDLELTRKCNLHCKYCYNNSGEALEEELTLSEILDTIDQACDVGSKGITLGGGEPLLYSNISSVIEYASKKGLIIVIFTNGTLLTPKTISLLKYYNVNLFIKMNSFDDQEIQNFLVGTEGLHLDEIKILVESLLEAGWGTTNGPKLSVSTIACKENVEQIPKLWQWCRKNRIIPFVERVIPLGRALTHNIGLGKEETFKLFSDLKGIDEREFNISWEVVPPIAAYGCTNHIHGYCYISSNGNVQPCSGLPIIVGNVKDDKLRNILLKHIFHELRNIKHNITGFC